MPKKRQYDFKPHQGSTAPSSTEARVHQNGTAHVPSVNERLQDLRRVEGKDAAAKKRALQETVNQRSLPPETQEILGHSPMVSPKPKQDPCPRSRERLRAAPGPAAPNSWARSAIPPARDATEQRRSSRHDTGGDNRFKPQEVFRFARLAGCPRNSIALDGVSSLSHMASKVLARLSCTFDNHDYAALGVIPLRLRLDLLSYIGIYRPSLPHAAFKALLQGHEDILALDLAGLIGHSDLMISKVQKSLGPSSSSTDLDALPESWDAEVLVDSSLHASLQPSRLSHLTHLCLSHPGPSVSWPDLLAFTKTTPQLTHLSLAYWPRPTLTPNLAATQVADQRNPRLGFPGSIRSRDLSSDIAESASVIRQLSANLLCLQWLDLDGCTPWIRALAWPACQTALDACRGIDTLPPPARERETREPTETRCVLLSNWKNLTCIRCAPRALPAVAGAQVAQSAQRPVTDMKLRDRLLEQCGDSSARDGPLCPSDVERAFQWSDAQSELHTVERTANALRRRHRLRPIRWDNGW